MPAASLRRRLARLRAFAMDVDGVLTDGAMYYGPRGEAMKRFHTRDGMGIRLLRESGIALAFISGEGTAILRHRAEKLRVVDVFGGVEEKLEVFRRWLASKGVSAAESAYMGDDVNDLEAIRGAGVAFAPADATAVVRRAADVVTRAPGGHGAVREACDRILAARR